MMILSGNTYVGFVWCPVAQEADVKRELAEFQTTEFMAWRSDYDAPHEI